MDLLKDPDGVYLIETTGVLDAALNKDKFADARKITNDLLITHYAAQDVASKALYEGRSIRINGDLVTISLDAYKQLSADAERGRWRISAEEPPPLEDRIHCKDANGFVSTRRIALCDLPNIAAWRPLD